ncbi:MAG: flagellin [Puniceicoccaceae bacterium]|nr:MAG: flagellin [Puniceicoccaceae bacterium]
MSVVINTNLPANAASANLAHSNQMLQRSLNRLSSGMKIVNPSDDAGGLAVSMKMSAAIKRTEAANTNIANAVSFLQTQDGALKTIGSILDRMSELKTLSEDVTKNSSDVANYATEYTQLHAQLQNLQQQKFNSVDVFGGSVLSVQTSEDGTESVNLTLSDVASVLNTTDVPATLAAATTTGLTDALQGIATARAQNGAESSRLNFASEMLTTNKINLEAANSRIIDVDVAAESTQLARYSILVQSGSAMLAQANASTQVALRLLG